MNYYCIIFIFRLLSFYFKDFFLIIPFIIFFFYFWVFFIKNNFYTVRTNPNANDILLNSKFLKKINYKFFNNWFFINFTYLFIYIFSIKIDFNNFWFNHLKINNFTLNIIIIIFFLSFFFLYLINFLKNSNINYNIDYFSSIINLIVFVPMIFFSNTMYTFLFILEIISLIILYKFSVSRSWFSDNKKTKFYRLLPKSYLNMLFFQYWANFFSSMMIMFSIFNLIFIYGSSEWVFLELLNNNNLNNFFLNNNNYVLIIIWFSFFIGIFFKIGFTPLHLFKIEVYKGIPFISIFFYTSWYFLSFFLYFTIIIYSNLISFSIFYNFTLFLFILIGLFYSISLLFDVNLIKSFFAYSTVVNAMNFIIVLYLIIN